MKLKAPELAINFGLKDHSLTMSQIQFATHPEAQTRSEHFMKSQCEQQTLDYPAGAAAGAAGGGGGGLADGGDGGGWGVPTGVLRKRAEVLTIGESTADGRSRRRLLSAVNEIVIHATGNLATTRFYGAHV